MLLDFKSHRRYESLRGNQFSIHELSASADNMSGARPSTTVNAKISI
jgi:hypothetical protein